MAQRPASASPRKGWYEGRYDIRRVLPQYNIDGKRE
jgi:hypothetical protein